MEWTRGRTIGRGSTAIVSIATSCRSGEIFAVKSTELSRSKLLQKEQSFLSKLSCPQIVRYLGFSFSIENNVPMYNLCIEYVQSGTLSDEIRRYGGKLDETKIKVYTHQILLGLEYLHTTGLAHCDVKSQNILVGSEGVKIADLGCAKMVEEVSRSKDSSFVGTPVFMAPEVARGEEQGFAADIWALGCTVIEMATGGVPWKNMNDPVSVLYRIGHSSDLPEFPSWFSEKAQDFLGKCLRRNSKERWTAKELLGHPFFEALMSDFNQEKELRMSSPSTVLEQDLWDSLEVLKSPQELAHVGSVLMSPSDRIRFLIGSNSNLKVPNWSLDESWFTIRCNGTEDTQNFADNSNVRSSDEPTSGFTVEARTPLITQQEELGILMYDHVDVSFDNSIEIIRAIDVERLSMMEYYYLEINYVSKNLKIECSCENLFFIQIQYCLYLAFSLAHSLRCKTTLLRCFLHMPLRSFHFARKS